jgi:hypothetical protein
MISPLPNYTGNGLQCLITWFLLLEEGARAPNGGLGWPNTTVKLMEPG